MRDHIPIVLEEFKGLWARGDQDSTPIDHFAACENIQFIQSGFKTRDGLDTYIAKGDVLRMYNYVMQTGESLLILDIHGDIYHAINQTTLFGPILSIPEMTDFGFFSIAGRAYITPFTTYINDRGVPEQKGLQDEFLYVYKGDGNPARKAAGEPPSNGSLEAFVAFNSGQDGVVSKGVHVIAVAFDGGPLGPEVLPVIQAPGDKQVQLTNIPTAVGVSRKIVMTHAIDPKDYVADTSGYTFYEVQTISDDAIRNVLINTADSGLTVSYTPGAGPAITTGALLAENTDEPGFSDFGFRLIGVVYETDTGYLTAPGPEFFAGLTTVDVKKQIHVSNIPVSLDPFVTKRHLVSTRTIPDYNGDQVGFQFYFIPDGTIENNVDTEIDLSYYDTDLISDASHLIDNFSEIPAGVALTVYHGRLVLTTEFDNVSIARISAVGEPEAISQVDGLVIAPLDGNPLTNAQEFRDVLYLFKKTKTLAYNDNGDVPSSWPLIPIDQGIGASVHGVGLVLDSGGVNIDYLLIIDFSGLMLFDGVYKRPELSWKIKDLWFSFDREQFNKIQIMNDSLSQIIYISLPIDTQNRILIGDYSMTLSPSEIRWAPWSFDIEPTTIALIETNKLLIGARAAFVPPPSELEPIIISIIRIDVNPNSNPTVSWLVTFDIPVQGVSISNFTLVSTGLTGTPAILSVSGSGTTWTVVASTGGDTGTLQLNLTNPSGITSLDDVALTSVLNGQTYVIERSAPLVVSITTDVDTPVASGSQQSWTVLFSQVVFNVDLVDFQLIPIGLSSSSLASISGSGTTYIITANVGNGNGSVGLNLVNNGTIINSQTIVLAAGFTGEVYTVQAVPTAPSNLLIIFASTSRVDIQWADNATNETSFEIERRVAFGSFLPLATVGANSTTYSDLTVTPATVYTYRVRAVNTIGNSAYVTSAQITTPSGAVNPAVLSINRAGSNPTNAAAVSWTVAFSEPVAGVTLSAFSLTSSGVSGTPTLSAITPSGGNTYIVTATTGSGGIGSVQLRLTTIAGITSIASGLPLLVGFDGQTYSVDRVAPTVSSLNRASTNPTTTGSTVTWTCIFSEVVTGVALSNFVLAGVSGTLIAVSGSGTTYTVTAIVGSSTGSFGLNLIP